MWNLSVEGERILILSPCTCKCTCYKEQNHLEGGILSAGNAAKGKEAPFLSYQALISYCSLGSSCVFIYFTDNQKMHNV